MASMSQIYEEFTGRLEENSLEYEPKELHGALNDLSDMELDELYDILIEEDFDYDYFAQWCEDHGVKYH